MLNSMFGSFAPSMEKKRDWDCLLCGKTVGSRDEGAYFERGFSKKSILCSDCYKHKVNLLNFDANPKNMEYSRSYMEEKIDGKVYEIQKIVTAWMDGTSQNYFPRLNDLVYHVEGPEAQLFVFRDRLVILSSLLASTPSGDYYAMLAATVAAASLPMNNVTIDEGDAVVVFPSGSNKKTGLVQFSIGYEDSEKLNFIPRREQEYLGETSDVKGMVNWMGNPSLSSLKDVKKEIIYSVKESQSGIYLEKSLGEYGTLNFAYEAPSLFNMAGNIFKFKFFYYQNQLMEEVYNYIVRQVNLAGDTDRHADMSSNVETTQAKSFYRSNQEVTTGEGDKAGFSLADEISKLKGLLDCGAITQDEYDEAKKRLISRV